MTVITRFAPSPTGYLHIGGARTALFNFLFAKRNGGKFLLRIEDTDKQRSTNEATEAIFDGLKWLGIEWDGEIIYQSKRFELYKKYCQQLIDNEKAYYCFTSQEEVAAQRNSCVAKKEHFIFRSKWRDADRYTYPSNIKPVVRLRAPTSGSTIVHDHLQGNVVTQNDHLDDMILLRSDQTPTYMLAVVVDDHEMNVTHIIRGDDHLTNAAKQVLIYNAFGWQVPEMVHVPLIHGSDGAKLSKRHGALGVNSYQEMGYLPEALCNYLLRLGWSHGNDEIISRAQAAAWFNLESLGKAAAKLDFSKMNFLNAQYLRAYNDDLLAEMTINWLRSKDISVNEQEKLFIIAAMPSLKARAELLPDLAELAQIFLTSKELAIDEAAKEIIENTDSDFKIKIKETIMSIEPFDKEQIQNKLKQLASEHDMKIGELMQIIRSQITGKINAPSVFEIMSIIGKEICLRRLSLSQSKPLYS